VLGKRHIVVCREGWYYLVVLSFIIAGAMMREINLLIVLAGMMIGPLLVNLRLAVATLRRFDVRRKLPESICAGDLLLVDLVATNGRRRLGSWTVVAQDHVRREDPDKGNGREKVEAMFPYVAPGRSAEATYQGRFERRGRYRFGPLRVSTRFPLGLIRRTVTIDGTDSILVYPRLGRLTDRWNRIALSERLGGQTSRRQQGLIEGDFYGLRDWRVGDSRRWIHWRTSAKRNKLAVREFEQQRDQDLTLLLDLWQDADPTPEQSHSVELAVSFAATVAADRCRRGGSQLFVGTAGKTTESIRGGASNVLLQELMQQLAVVEASPQTDLPGLLRLAMDETRPGTRTVIVGTRPTDVTDTERFAAIWDDPKKRNAIRRIVCIDAGSGGLAEYFYVDQFDSPEMTAT